MAQGRLGNFWPEIVDVETAQKAAKGGAHAAFLVGGITAVVGTIAIVNGPFLGYDGWSLADAALVGIMGWRILRMSRAWAVVGLLYWIYTLGMRLAAGAGPSAFGILTILILVYFISGVRGTFAYHRYKKEAPAEVAAV